MGFLSGTLFENLVARSTTSSGLAPYASSSTDNDYSNNEENNPVILDNKHPQSSVSTQGILFGIFSSLTTAFHAIIIKDSLDVVRGKTLDLVYYNNLLSAVGLFPIMLFMGELGACSAMVKGAWTEFAVQMQTSGSSSWWWWLSSWMASLVYDVPTPSSSMLDASVVVSTDEYNGMSTTAYGAGSVNALTMFIVGGIVSGAFGFLINLAGFLQIQVTSPVTHMISSAFRG
ncbi:hypothetical protein HK102_007751, partial [Quaeritorhiza haematococci]